jgi:hypothetical protein
MCESSNTAHQAPSVPSTSVASTEAQAFVKGKLNTSQYEFAPKWIPVQPTPQFEERQSLTAENSRKVRIFILLHI